MKRPFSPISWIVTLALGASLLGACNGNSSNSSGSGSGDPGTGVSSILFVKRAYQTGSGSSAAIDVSGGWGSLTSTGRYVPGGSLNILSPPRQDGQLTNLTNAFPNADIEVPFDVSPDGTMALFSMKVDGNSPYHIFSVALTPTNGQYVIHQITGSGSNDYYPVLLQNDIIAFVTDTPYTPMGTRTDEYEHGGQPQIATVTLTGGDATRRYFPQNQSGTFFPFRRSNGRLGLARWEHFAGSNDMKLFEINPDGTGMVGVQGQHGGTPAAYNSLISCTENLYINNPINQFLCVASNREGSPFKQGSLAVVSAANQADSNCTTPGVDHTGHQCLDEENAAATNVTPNIVYGTQGGYNFPHYLPNGRIIASWAGGSFQFSETAETAPKFQIVVVNPSTGVNQVVYQDNNYYNLGPIPITSYVPPPAINNLQSAMNSSVPALIGSLNIADSDLDQNVEGAQFSSTLLATALQSATGVRVLEGFGSEAMNCVPWGPYGANCGSFGMTAFEGAAIIGTAKVQSDGSWLANVPPYIPIHLQAVDKFGLSIAFQPLWMGKAPGENGVCRGCHESRTAAVNATSTATIAAQVGAQNMNNTIAQRIEIPFASPTEGPNNETPSYILQQKCAPCHSANPTQGTLGPTDYYYPAASVNPVSGTSSTYKIPFLDLSNTPMDSSGIPIQSTDSQGNPISSTPALENPAFTAAYVSLLYPAGLTMTATLMSTIACGGTVNGQKADGTPCFQVWVTPSSSRATLPSPYAALIQKINPPGINQVTGQPDGTRAWAGMPAHPDDVGGTPLTLQEYQILIQWVDIGAQFYARQQGGGTFQPITNDPVAPPTN